MVKMTVSEGDFFVFLAFYIMKIILFILLSLLFLHTFHDLEAKGVTFKNRQGRFLNDFKQNTLSLLSLHHLQLNNKEEFRFEKKYLVTG